jgi:hypothetical protein
MRFQGLVAAPPLLSGLRTICERHTPLADCMGRCGDKREGIPARPPCL